MNRADLEDERAVDAMIAAEVKDDGTPLNPTFGGGPSKGRLAGLPVLVSPLRDATVIAVIEELREDCLDTAGQPMPDGAELFTPPTCGMIRILLAAIDAAIAKPRAA